MKLKKGFITHSFKDKHYIISTGKVNFSGIVKNNETAAFIVDCLKEDTTEAEIVDKIISEYNGVDRLKAENDVKDIIGKLRSIEAIEG